MIQYKNIIIVLWLDLKFFLIILYAHVMLPLVAVGLITSYTKIYQIFDYFFQIILGHVINECFSNYPRLGWSCDQLLLF